MSKKTKKVTYANLLKEALSDFTEIPKSVDTAGPFLDPIMSYRGDGELPTHKDAASILERYYFQEEQDSGVSIAIDEEESVVNKDIVTVGKDKAALPDEPEDVEDSKDDIEDAMAMEQEEIDMKDEEEEEKEEEKEEMEEWLEQIVPNEPAGLAGDEDELPPRKGADGEGQVEPAELKEDENVESAVIEKLISEMEDEGEEEKEEEEEEEEKEEEVEEQAEPGKEEEDKEEEELDVDKEMKGKEEVEEQIPIQKIAGAGGLDKEEMQESFRIFKEQIEEEDEEEKEEEAPEVSSKEVTV